MKFTNVVTINRPRAAVFAYLADLENLPRWNYAISETRRLTSGPVGAGMRYRQTRTLPSLSQETLEVTEFEPDRKLSIEGGLGPLHGRVHYLLESEGGSTRLTNTMDLHAAGPLSLVARLGASRVRSAVAANLDTLKQLLEAVPAG